MGVVFGHVVDEPLIAFEALLQPGYRLAVLFGCQRLTLELLFQFGHLLLVVSFGCFISVGFDALPISLKLLCRYHHDS